MDKEKSKALLRIELTPEQREQIRKITGAEVSALELTPEELEERVAPVAKISCRGGGG